MSPALAARAAAVLAAAARALHAEREAGRVLTWTAEAARTLTGAEAAGVWTDDRRAWTVSPQSARTASLGDPWTMPSLSPVVRDVSALHVPDLPRGDHEDVRAALPGFTSILAVPVPTAEGAAQGVLTVVSVAPDAFTPDDGAGLAALAAHLGVALENAARQRAVERARATEREIVEQLQNAVVPARPEVPFTELGASYSPADPGAHTGGDLHDWVLLRDGDLHLAVVDVMGKGVGATKDALAVTHALRLLVLDGSPLDEIVARADAIVTAQDPDLVATLLVARYRPSTGELQLVGGGHPPALLVHDDVATPLFARGIPIGYPGAGSDEVVKVDLARGDTVVLYTDGLVEGTKDIVEGLASLHRFAEETSHYPAQQQARILVERALQGAARRDDQLALVLRRRSPVEARRPALGPFEHRLSRSAAAVPVCRGLLREWLVHVPVDPDPTEDLLLVATELCSNAVAHASWRNGGVVLRARTEGADVVIEVSDDGEGLGWTYGGTDPPDPNAESGRGLWLVHTFSDEVVQEVDERRTIVRCVKRAVVS